MTHESEKAEELMEVFSSDLSEEVLEQVAAELVDELRSGITEELSGELVDAIAEEFPELTFKSKPIEDVLSSFREDKIDEVDSERQYNTMIDYIEEYFEERGIETTDDLTSEDVENYDSWRKYESLDRDEPLADTTLQDDMYLFREFIEELTGHNMAPIRFEKHISIPEVDHSEGEGVDEKKLDPELAQAALEYLRKYEYASVDHIAFELFCHFGGRTSDIWSRDVEDYDEAESAIEFIHREATELKNDEKSERTASIFSDLDKAIDDYLTDTRPPVTENGREPLLTKGDGRISKSTLKTIAYAWTRPCKIGLECPHDRDPEECEAAQRRNTAYKCPSSRAPHHFRKGYITDQRNRGVSPEAIEQRCDVSPPVQDIYYDFPSDDEEQERHEDEFRDADADPDSGFSY